VLTNEAEIAMGTPSRVAPNVRGDRAAIEAAAVLCASAKRPLIFAGDAIAQSDALAETVAFAELLGAPVYAEAVSSRASFPSSHPLFFGAMVRLQKNIREILAQHDLVISLGADLFTLSLPSPLNAMPENVKIVHLDTDPWEIAKNYAVEAAIFGEPKVTLPELAAETQARMTRDEHASARTRDEETRRTNAQARAKLAASASEAAKRTPIEPLALLQTIAATLPPNAVVIDETVSSGMGMRSLLRSDDAQSYFGLRGGGIGWGLPAAIGAQLALPNRPVVALIGDGSAMYTVQGLWTAAHEKLAVTFVIFNNTSYKILKQRALAMGALTAETKRFVAMDLTEPAIDFVGLARSLGVAAERVTTLDEVRAHLKRGLSSKVPNLIEVVIAA